jgi:hypothetical protein
MLNNSGPGQAVYKPFLGSGTTLIAAETTGRVCLAIELEPLHVDVAVRRWQAFTGNHAVLQSTGRRFDEVETERSRLGATPPVKGPAGQELPASGAVRES